VLGKPGGAEAGVGACGEGRSVNAEAALVELGDLGVGEHRCVDAEVVDVAI